MSRSTPIKQTNGRAKSPNKVASAGETEPQSTSYKEESVTTDHTRNPHVPSIFTQLIDPTKKGYTTSLDIDGTPLYHYKYRRQHDHVFLEQLISRDDFGDENPRYYVGTNEDAQPMTLPELTTLIQDLIRFYGDAVTDRHQTGEER